MCTTVRIPILHVERVKTDHCNILGVVVDIDEKGQYQVQKKQGVLNTPFCWNQSELCKQNISLIQDLPQEKHQYTPVCLWGCQATAASQGHRQGFKHATAEGTVQRTDIDAESTKWNAIHTVIQDTWTVKSMPECADERETENERERRKKKRF